MTLVGALLIFGERLNLYQWIGVLLAVVSFFMLSRSGKKEGISFEHNRWVWFVVLAALLGAISGLYDKYLMGMFNNMVVQAWYNIYQLFMMGGGADVPVASEAQDHYSFPLGLVHPADFPLPFGGRLRIFLCLRNGRLDDFHRVDGAAGKRGGIVPLRCHGVPRKEPAEQGGRPRTGASRHVLPVSGEPVSMRRNSFLFFL